MPAYVFVVIEKINNAAKMAEYRTLGMSTLQETSVRYRIRPSSPVELLEGEPIQGIVLLEFPSLQEARDWYDSPLYQEALKFRREGAICHAFMVEGN
jgi:uncharacterized protein (DUF1330 family)